MSAPGEGKRWPDPDGFRSSARSSGPGPPGDATVGTALLEKHQHIMLIARMVSMVSGHVQNS